MSRADPFVLRVDPFVFRLPHIHAEFQGEVIVFAINDGSVLDGSLPNSKRKLVEAWIEIHRDELLADWQLAVEGETVFKIKGLE